MCCWSVDSHLGLLSARAHGQAAFLLHRDTMEEPERSMIGADWLGALGPSFAQVVEFVNGERNAFACLKEGNQSMSMAPLAPEARFWTHLKLQISPPLSLGYGDDRNLSKPVKKVNNLLI